ncbi:MAG: YigZ family protein [Ignavibacteriaceae bacterium]|nr:YigZ family protein [Ignavibacteriaceae bacterium]
MLQSSNSSQQITIVEGFTEYILKEKGSSFVGQVFPITTAKEAKDILTEVKKKRFDATHHCYAYKCANGDTKFSDDGEPSGTAGIRLLNAITHFNLTNVLVIVIRYFGGTKLGVGPLGKAYYLTATETLEQSKKVIKYPAQKVTLTFSFEAVNAVYKLLTELEIKITGTNYSENISLSVIIKVKILEKIKETLVAITSGKIEFAVEPEIIFI